MTQLIIEAVAIDAVVILLNPRVLRCPCGAARFPTAVRPDRVAR